ncbi:type II toxin-antitoxin system VapC family toxin [Aerosakkonemataceae cyanobacterium BLCC-F50]|uniref:Type II toxin-antitoxin system VapC family toxin n=1 Tax=Floridaenema flaviceps BLCC-F50 TaxID=3153642 RepID=A0ABV4XRI4_9CYAN
MGLSKPIKRFLDTNILVYSLDLSVENRQRHRASLEILRPSSTEILCISPQILGEFYAVVTRPSLLANPLTPQETLSRIDRLLQMQHIELLSMSEQVFKRWLELLKRNPVTGATVFDLMHVATMMIHGVKSIYTFNVDDFKGITDIEIILPTGK